jgi:ribokinase
MKPDMFDVIVCGSLHLDIVVKAPALPRIDETAVGQSWHKLCGGKGGNQAVQAARAGARTAMIGRVGDDEFGQTLRANLVAAGVDAAGIATDTVQGSGMSVAILQDNGDYGAVIVSGANLAIAPTTLDQQWQALGGAKVLVLQNEVPHSVNVAAAQAARDGGAQVVFNAAPARAMGRDLLDLVDVLIVNRVEAEALFGVAVTDRASARQVLEAAGAAKGAIVITLGGDGLVLATADGAVHVIAPVPVKVTSTHGAGDCFVGVLAARLAAGASLLAGCKAANEQAAAFVSRQA